MFAKLEQTSLSADSIMLSTIVDIQKFDKERDYYQMERNIVQLSLYSASYGRVTPT
jgi:hypothetical protein